MEALKNVYKTGGGVHAFWSGTSAKMVESGTKGAILMYAKEGLNDALLKNEVDPGLAGVIAGAGGGIAQVSVMGPCTYLVTGAVNDPSGKSSIERIRETYARAGVKGFYPGGTAIAFRQATNWASVKGSRNRSRESESRVVSGRGFKRSENDQRTRSCVRSNWRNDGLLEPSV